MDKIKTEILLALNADTVQLKTSLFYEAESKYGNAEFYSALDYLLNGNYIVMPVDIAADGSKMFSITPTTKLTPKGLSVINSRQ